MGLATAPGRFGRAAARGLIAVLLLGVVGCGGPPSPIAAPEPDPVDPAPVVLRQPSLGPQDEVPEPDGEPILTLSGRIGATNSRNALSFDPATLDELGLVRVTVYEPWVKQTLNFQGVWLQDLMALARPAPEASSLHFRALDDYQIDLSVSDAMGGGVFLATRDGEGRPIPVEDGGPTRILFTGGVPAGASADQWIWSLTTIDVR